MMFRMHMFIILMKVEDALLRVSRCALRVTFVNESPVYF
jgi:hypothetical protein